MFKFRYSSLLEFEKDFRDEKLVSRNLQSLFNIYFVPSDDTFRYALQNVSTDSLNELVRKIHYTLERQKKIQPLKFLDKYYLLAVDGTGQVTSYNKHCDDCLTRTKDDKTLYLHYIVNAVLTDKNASTALSMAYESSKNTDQKKKFDKNDCELKISKRLFKNLKKMYPNRRFCILGDNLYGVKPVLTNLIHKKWKFIITAKPKRNKELFRNFEVRGDERTSLTITTDDGRKHKYLWANALPFIGESYKKKRRFHTNLVEYWEYDINGKKLYHSSWMTNIELNKSVIVDVVKAGRARFGAIENRCFNVQKNQGYRLSHNFGHKGNLHSVFFGLTQVAHILTELFSVWKTGKKLIKQIGSQRRFFEKLGNAVVEGAFLITLEPVFYIKLVWDTS